VVTKGLVDDLIEKCERGKITKFEFVSSQLQVQKCDKSTNKLR